MRDLSRAYPWRVKITEGWMVGIQSFRTKKLAQEFYDRWLVVAVNSGIQRPDRFILWMGKKEVKS